VTTRITNVENTFEKSDKNNLAISAGKFSKNLICDDQSIELALTPNKLRWLKKSGNALINPEVCSTKIGIIPANVIEIRATINRYKIKIANARGIFRRSS
jgi:hypothetical protein